MQDSVENHAAHHEEENEIAGLRGKRDRAHGAQQDQRVDAHAEEDRPEEDLLAPAESEELPVQIREHLIEGDLVSGADSDQSDDEGEVEEEDTEFAESLPWISKNINTFLATTL